MTQDLTSAAGAAIAKSAPPVGVVSLAALGAIDMTFLVGIATFTYVVAQLGYLIWKWRREAKGKQ